VSTLSSDPFYPSIALIVALIGKSSLTISAKPDGAGAASQRLILRGEQSGLQTRTAMMESVSLCVPMKVDCVCGTRIREPRSSMNYLD
jgi:hypothetical protein